MKFKLLLFTILISFSAFGQNRTEDIIVNGVNIGRYITVDQTRELCKSAVKPRQISWRSGLPERSRTELKFVELSNGNFILPDQKVSIINPVQYIELYSEYTNAEDIDMSKLEIISYLTLSVIGVTGMILGVYALSLELALIGVGAFVVSMPIALLHNFRTRKHLGFRERR